MKGVLTAAVGVLALALAPAAVAGNLVLVPQSFGGHTVASWRAQEGLADTVGMANQALVLQKDDNTPGTAATAVFNGLENEKVTALKGLQWHRRTFTDCNATSPRWTLVVRGHSGREYLTRFGCALSAHIVKGNWTQDVNSQTLIRARVLAAGGKDALAGTIVSLGIVYDLRGKAGFSILDNVTVNSSVDGLNVWTCAADNAAVAPGAPSFGPDDLVASPFSDMELRTLEDMWPLMTPEDQAIASSDGDVVY